MLLILIIGLTALVYIIFWYPRSGGKYSRSPLLFKFLRYVSILPFWFLFSFEIFNLYLKTDWSNPLIHSSQEIILLNDLKNDESVLIAFEINDVWYPQKNLINYIPASYFTFEKGQERSIDIEPDYKSSVLLIAKKGSNSNNAAFIYTGAERTKLYFSEFYETTRGKVKFDLSVHYEIIAILSFGLIFIWFNHLSAEIRKFKMLLIAIVITIVCCGSGYFVVNDMLFLQSMM